MNTQHFVIMLTIAQKVAGSFHLGILSKHENSTFCDHPDKTQNGWGLLHVGILSTHENSTFCDHADNGQKNAGSFTFRDSVNT